MNSRHTPVRSAEYAEKVRQLSEAVAILKTYKRDVARGRVIHADLVTRLLEQVDAIELTHLSADERALLKPVRKSIVRDAQNLDAAAARR